MNMKQIIEMIDSGLIDSYVYKVGNKWKFEIGTSNHVLKKRGGRLKPDMTGLLISIGYFTRGVR